MEFTEASTRCAQTTGRKGLGAVGEGLESAYLGSVITIVGLLIGLILVGIGGVKAYKQSKSKTASGE